MEKQPFTKRGGRGGLVWCVLCRPPKTFATTAGPILFSLFRVREDGNKPRKVMMDGPHFWFNLSRSKGLFEVLRKQAGFAVRLFPFFRVSGVGESRSKEFEARHGLCTGKERGRRKRLKRQERKSERNAHMCSFQRFVMKPTTRGERIVCFAIQLKCALETVTASG